MNDSPGVADHRTELLRMLIFNRGNGLQDKGRLDDAETVFRKAVDLSGKWVTEFPNVAELRVLQAHSHNGLGHTLWRMRRSQEGETECGKALELFEKLVADFPNTVEYQSHVANCHSQQGGFFARDNKPRPAEEAYRKSVAAFKKLAGDFPDVRDYRHELGRSHNWLGILLAGTGRLQEAEQEHRQAVDLYEKLIQEVDHLAAQWHRRELAWSYGHLAKVLQTGQRLEEAEAAYRQALALCEKLDTDFPAAETYGNWIAGNCQSLASLLAASGRPDEAEKLFRRLLELKPKNALAHNNLAWLLATSPDPKFRDAGRAVELAKKAVELDPKSEFIWNTLGVAHYRAGEWKAAIEALAKSEELATGRYFGFNAVFLAMANWQLGEPDEARKWYDQAVEWMEKNKPQDEELRRFRTEAAELLGIEKKDVRSP